jgi:hypothetical protein
MVERAFDDPLAGGAISQAVLVVSQDPAVPDHHCPASYHTVGTGVAIERASEFGPLERRSARPAGALCDNVHGKHQSQRPDRKDGPGYRFECHTRRLPSAIASIVRPVAAEV